MRAIRASAVGLAAGCAVVVLVFVITGNLEPIRNLFLIGGVSLAIAAPLSFMDDHRRKKRVKPL
jgi:hypothetical protein